MDSSPEAPHRNRIRHRTHRSKRLVEGPLRLSRPQTAPKDKARRIKGRVKDNNHHRVTISQESGASSRQATTSHSRPTILSSQEREHSRLERRVSVRNSKELMGNKGETTHHTAGRIVSTRQLQQRPPNR